MPRKTLARAASAREMRTASMRPRPDAAENLIAALLGAGDDPASMRPRPDAAENDLLQRTSTAFQWLQ